MQVFCKTLKCLDIFGRQTRWSSGVPPEKFASCFKSASRGGGHRNERIEQIWGVLVGSAGRVLALVCALALRPGRSPWLRSTKSRYCSPMGASTDASWARAASSTSSSSLRFPSTRRRSCSSSKTHSTPRPSWCSMPESERPALDAERRAARSKWLFPLAYALGCLAIVATHASRGERPQEESPRCRVAPGASRRKPLSL